MKKINLVSYFLARRRDRRIAEQKATLQAQADKEVERQVAEREYLTRLFATNPDLHARVMLTGRRFVHYLEIKDLADLHARAADQREIRCILN